MTNPIPYTSIPLWIAKSKANCERRSLSWVTSLLRAHGFRLKEFIAVIVSGAIGGWLLWLGATKIFPQPLAVAELYGIFGVPLFLAFFFLAIVTFAGISSHWTNDEDREWWGRAAGWLLAVIVGWTAISGLVVFGPLLLSRAISTWPDPKSWTG